jgi:hypothetical protein
MKLLKILIIGVLLFIIIKMNGNHENFNNISESYIRNGKQLLCAENSIPVDGWCYKKCRHGYKPDGTNCVMDCPSDLKSTNTHCLKTSEFIGKEYKTLEECNLDNPNGCYKEENKFYGICSSDKKQVGHYCVDKCPTDMLDNGFGCLRTRYITQTGDVKEGEKCDTNQDRVGDMCYDKCKEGYAAKGAMCIYTPK